MNINDVRKKVPARISPILAIFSLLAAVLVFSPGITLAQEAEEATGPIPRFWIVEVVQNEHVTIETGNFPANQAFTVRMGPMGTMGIDGTVVTTTPSDEGGTFRQTYTIPEHLHTSERISIRLESAQGPFAFNWFYNRNWSEGDPVGIGAVQPGTVVDDPTVDDPVAVGPPEEVAPTAVPNIRIVEVVQNESVTIETANFPANQNFTVRMGPIGTEAIGGTIATTTPSGEGGTFRETYPIPENLHTSNQISIRLDSPQGFFAFNWFFNQDFSE